MRMLLSRGEVQGAALVLEHPLNRNGAVAVQVMRGVPADGAVPIGKRPAGGDAARAVNVATPLGPAGP